jgi:hypothetical protein
MIESRYNFFEIIQRVSKLKITVIILLANLGDYSKTTCSAK